MRSQQRAFNMRRAFITRVLFVFCLVDMIFAASSRGPSLHRSWMSDVPSHRRADDANGTDSRQYLSCSAPDVLFVIETSAKQLMKKFDGAMKDVKLIARLLVETNEKGGDADPVLRDEMCCCDTLDWEELGRTSAWAGFHNCDDNRKNELYFGNKSMEGGYGVYTRTRTIDTDLAWLSPASTLFPWIIDRQTVSFDRDGFYAAAWIGTNGEVWSYYPGFNQIWPDHHFGDFVGGDYNGRDDIFVKATLPSQNPLRRPLWTQPYLDPAGAGNMISAITPIYFNGPFRGHTFNDEYVAATGIDILLIYMESLVASVKPTASALPLVIDDDAHLVSAPSEVVEAIFGPGVTLEDTISCEGDGGGAISQQLLSCKITESDTADWRWLMTGIIAEPRGRRRLLEGHITIAGVRHQGFVFRWEGEDTPPWNSVVLVPQHELEQAFSWEAPSDLTAEVKQADGKADLQLTLTNTGSVALVYRLKSLPSFASVKATKPATPGNKHIGVDIRLPAQSTVQYTLELEAKKTSGRGTHSQTLAWELRDDDYPDCIVQTEASISISLTVNLAADSITIIVVACVIAGVCALAIAAFVYTSWKHRQADAVWSIKLQDLHFKTDPPEVLGRGTYGLVVAAEYRKTPVAVKRVIPPAATHSEMKKMTMFGKGVEKPGASLLLDQLFAHRSLNSQSDPLPPKFFKGPAPGMGSSRRAWTNHLASSSTNSRGMMSKSQGVKRKSLFQRCCGCLVSEHDRMRQEFVEEMRHVSKMRHPCITTMMGAVIGGGKCEPMLVMELMEHGSLRGVLSNKSIALEPALMAPMVRDVIQGMAFLHAAKPAVVHGDLKAHNILVDRNFRAKVADFGLSNPQDAQNKLKLKSLTGTPTWMAPELLEADGGHRQPTTETDVYAFGILLWEMATRETPYRKELEEGIEYATIVDEVRRGVRRPEVPEGGVEWMTNMMTRCWDHEPAQRPSFKDLDDEVESLHLTGFHAAAMSSLENFKASLHKSESVLKDVFPPHVVQQLMDGKQVAAERKEEVTIFFSDIVGYTDISSKLEATEVTDMLHRLYKKLDALAKKHHVFKMGIIGDAWMGVTNIESDQADSHASRMARFALDAVEAARQTPVCENDPSMGFVQIRGGFHSGPVVADVVGTTNLQYCLFGDTVNTASRMESTSEAMVIQCSSAAARLVHQQDSNIPLSLRGRIEVKGKGSMSTYFVGNGKPAAEDAGAQGLEFFMNEKKGDVMEGMNFEVASPRLETASCLGKPGAREGRL
mmetsp:Transcript_62516/g.146986  ORF Transcript_62516/g.146986 Transcript_62516/m.146986 type:complete len:1259 (-) Transcript_62516:160-3936(-)